MQCSLNAAILDQGIMTSHRLWNLQWTYGPILLPCRYHLQIYTPSFGLTALKFKIKLNIFRIFWHCNEMCGDGNSLALMLYHLPLHYYHYNSQMQKHGEFGILRNIRYWSGYWFLSISNPFKALCFTALAIQGNSYALSVQCNSYAYWWLWRTYILD